MGRGPGASSRPASTLLVKGRCVSGAGGRARGLEMIAAPQAFSTLLKQ